MSLPAPHPDILAQRTPRWPPVSFGPERPRQRLPDWSADLIRSLRQSEVFAAEILHDRGGIVVIAQVHSDFLKIDRVPAVIGEVIATCEMQDGAFREFGAPAIPERFGDADNRAGAEIPDIHHTAIFTNRRPNL